MVETFEKLSTITIKCAKEELDQYMTLIPYIYKQWDFRVRYSIRKIDATITLYDIHKKEKVK